MNKCLTVILNSLIWDQHAKPEGILCLFVCIGGGMIYRQAPMRGERKEVIVSAGDEEFKAKIGSDVPSMTDEEMAPANDKSGFSQRRK